MLQFLTIDEWGSRVKKYKYLVNYSFNDQKNQPQNFFAILIFGSCNLLGIGERNQNKC